MYKGDEKIKTFIWDLITPNETGEANVIARDHSGLHNLVPRGRNAKGGKGTAMSGQTTSDASSPSAPSTPNPSATDASAKPIEASTSETGAALSETEGMEASTSDAVIVAPVSEEPTPDTATEPVPVPAATPDATETAPTPEGTVVPIEGASELPAPVQIPGPPPTINDPDHWSKSEHYDVEAFLEAPYKKHLGRHANK